MDQSIVSKRIKEKRGKAGFNQTQLAEEADVSPSAISQIESGERFPSTLVLHRIAKALKTSIDYLLGKNEEEFSDLLDDKGVEMLFRTYKDLSESDKETLLNLAKIMKAKKR